jgi:hypothetical protein
MKSADIWTQEDLSSNHEELDGLQVWRFVEAQHLIATTPLVDNWEEQAILEDILEDTKPPIPEELVGVDFLLATPFRYRAVAGSTNHDRGSRFRHTGSVDGVFYAARDPHTCAFEAGFYRALFFAESPGLKLPTNAMYYTAFSTKITTQKALNLTTHPVLSAYSTIWEDPANYDICQKLAADARRAGVEVIIYKSVRDPKGGLNYAVLTPKAFLTKRIEKRQTWTFLYSTETIFMACECPKAHLQLTMDALRNDPRFR